MGCMGVEDSPAVSAGALGVRAAHAPAVRPAPHAGGPGAGPDARRCCARSRRGSSWSPASWWAMSSGVESPPADARAPSAAGSRRNQLGLFVLLVAVAALLAYLLISLVLLLLGVTPGVSVAACIANQ